MKEQLQKLAEEMISEIKDLKDLTKKELPELAKEFIKYNSIVAVVGLVISFLGAVLSSLALLYAYNVSQTINELHTHDSDGTIFVLLVLGIIGIISSLCFIFTYLGDYLLFKYQPRRMAIKAITSLF